MMHSTLKIFLCFTFCFSFFLNAQNPNWKVNSAKFSLDASIIAELQIDNIGFSDVNDIVASFDENNQIRGVANVTYIAALNKYFVFLTLNGNSGGDQLTFKVYDFSENTVLDVPETTLEFIPNKITGDAENPFILKGIHNFLPTAKTYLATNITSSSATLSGEILSKGKSDELTERGFVFSTENTYPKLNEPNTSKIPLSNTIGSFTHTANNLNTDRNINYYRAYASNSFGTSYGDVKRFSLNNALHFDGTNDYLTISDNSTFHFSNGFSVDAMLYPTSFINTSTIISQFENTQKAFSIAVSSGGIVTATFSLDGTSETSSKSNLRLSLNKWQHLTVTYNNGIIKIFINGTEDVTAFVTNASTGAIFNSSAAINIGSKNESDYFTGTLDELRIWNKPLNSSIINAIKNKTIPKHINGLITYYNFNQGTSEGDNTSIIQVVDKTDNHNHATITNFTKSGASSNFINGITKDFDNNKVAQNTFVARGNWSNPNNWSFGSVPKKVDRAIITENQEITVDITDLEIDELVLKNNATLKIPKDKAIIINNQFDSNGNLELDSDASDSGVLLVNGETTGTITYKRGGLLANKWSIVTPPVSGQKIKEFIENSDNNIRVNTTPDPNRYAVAYYDDNKPVGTRWVYYTENITNTEEFTAGKSYSMSRATDGEFTFTGTLTVNNLKRTLVAGQWNAIGNPFTTYYPANKNSNSSFLKDNYAVLDDAFKSLYIWDNNQGKYVAVTEISEVAKSLPPGQGFFIKLKADENEIQFHKDKRSAKPVTGNTTFEKNNTNTSIFLKATSNKTTVATEIKFFDNATAGFDAGYDIGNFTSAGLDIHTRLMNNDDNTNFTIQSLANNSISNLKIPIGIKGEKGNLITISATNVNLPTNIKLYLEDTETHSFINLTDKNAHYQFTLKDDVNDVGRFYIHTLSSVLNTGFITKTTLKVFTVDKKLIIKNINDKTADLKIYSIQGKEVLHKKVNLNIDQEISLSNFNTGIYLIKIESDTTDFSKKIIID